MARKYKGSFRLPLNRKSRPLRPTSWEHKSRGRVRKSNTPPTKPDLQGYKKGGGGINPQQDQTPPPPFKETVGSALLSHNPPVAVPSAQKGLTSRFGKDTGCNPLAKTTNTTNKQHPKKRDNHSPVSETTYPLNNPTHKPPNKRGSVKAVLVVNRTVDANTPKNKPPTKTSRCNKNYC